MAGRRCRGRRGASPSTGPGRSSVRGWRWSPTWCSGSPSSGALATAAAAARAWAACWADTAAASWPVTWACWASREDGGGVGLAEGGGPSGLVGPVLRLPGLERGLLGLQGVLGGVQLVHLGGDVAHGQAGVLAGRLGAGRAPGEQRGVAARRVRPRVDVRLDGLALDDLRGAGRGPAGRRPAAGRAGRWPGRRRPPGPRPPRSPGGRRRPGAARAPGRWATVAAWAWRLPTVSAPAGRSRCPEGEAGGTTSRGRHRARSVRRARLAASGPVNGVDPERNTRPRIYRPVGTAGQAAPRSPGQGGVPRIRALRPCPTRRRPVVGSPRSVGGGTMARYDEQFMRHTGRVGLEHGARSGAAVDHRRR